MPGTPTTKYAIPTMDGSVDLARSIDNEVNAALTAIDSKMAGYSEGPLGSRPVSSGGTPGVAGRVYRANDAGNSVYYIDNGTGWDRLARIVGFATSTWDPASVANGASATTTLSVTGAVATDLVIVSFSGLSSIIGGVVLFGHVGGFSGPPTVSVTLANLSGGSIDLPSGTLTVVVLRP